MRALKAFLVLPLLTLGWWVLMPVGPAAALEDVRTECAGATTAATTYTLNADCDTTQTLVVPDGFTLDGAGHTITAHDPMFGPFPGAVVRNEGGSMHVTNLTVRGMGFKENCTGSLSGVLFDDADGSVTNVTVLDITQHSGCILGRGLSVTAADSPRTVAVTGFVATGFQRSGLVASGTVTVNVAGSTFGPADATITPGLIAQNSAQYIFGAGGTFTGNTVVGRGFGAASNQSTGMLLFTASNVTITDNTISGDGTDLGIAVAENSANVRIENNQIGRTPPAVPDGADAGFGVSVDASSAPNTTLVCNQFDGWKADLDGVTQAPCITTNASLPNGRVGSPYAASLEATAVTPPVTWSVGGGALPPGLTLGPDGTITGDPTTEGTFTFTAIVTDADGLTSSLDFTIIVTAALPPPAPAIAGAKFTPLPPARIVDTRTGLGGASGPRQPASTTTFTAAGVGGVPTSGVRAVVLNVTATEPAAPGFIQVFPAGTSAPGTTSSVNVDHAGQTIANLVIIGVDASGRFSVYTQSATQLVVDVFGYYTDVPESTSGRLVTIDPIRVLDTRKGLGTGSTNPIPAQGTVAVTMPEAVPTDAQAVVMTLTADQGLAPGYIQAIPTGGATPLGASSNINIDRAGETMADTVIVPLGANGTVTLLTQSGAHLVVDVVGYFTGDSAPSATTGLFIPIPPARVRDTRVTGGVVASGATLEVPFKAEPQLAAVPPSAVAGNITATNTTASGYVQLIPTGTTTAVGSTSTLNINGAERIVAANSILSGVTGSITVHNQSATHLVYDVTGYFL